MEEKLTAEQRKDMWRQRLEQLKASNMTQKDWCRENGIPQTTLRYWIRRLKDEAPKDPAWIQLQTKRPEAAAERNITISCNGVKMIINADADPLLCRRLIRVMTDA